MQQWRLIPKLNQPINLSRRYRRVPHCPQIFLRHNLCGQGSHRCWDGRNSGDMQRAASQCPAKLMGYRSPCTAG